MKILVYEWVSAGGMIGQHVPDALRRDGEAMAGALLDDLTGIPGTEVATVRGEDASPIDLPVAIRRATSPEESLEHYRAFARTSDAVWPIAPESDGLLARLVEIAGDSGAALVGCSAGAVRTCSSKHATSAALRAAAIPCVATYRHGDAVPDAPGVWVIKPDDGAGCDDMFMVPGARDAARYLARFPDRVAQPWMKGRAMSLSVLYRHTGASLLACNRQHIEVARGKVALAGVDIDVATSRREAFERIAQQIGLAIAGLSGFVGIDVVDADDGPCVIEINPRLTLSYCGLSRAIGTNVAALALAPHRQSMRGALQAAV